MPHRIQFFCIPCSQAAKRQVEVMDVTFWIDEDKVLYFIACCDCGNSETVKTSADELHVQMFPREAPLQLVM